jgi:hypothetical protein
LENKSMRCKSSKFSTIVLMAALGAALAVADPAVAQRRHSGGGGGVHHGPIAGGGARLSAGPRAGGAMTFGAGPRGGGGSTFRAAPRGGGGVFGGRRFGGTRHFGGHVRRYGGSIYFGPIYPYDYYYNEPYFFDDYVEIPEYYAGRTVEYCIRRFKSYDLATRTYLGYDGRQHPCP